MELEREWEERAYLLTGKGNRGEPIEREVGDGNCTTVAAEGEQCQSLFSST